MSVLIVSLYVQGGAARAAALVLLAASVIGVLVGLIRKRNPRSDSGPGSTEHSKKLSS